jgi:hypothetical protein
MADWLEQLHGRYLYITIYVRARRKFFTECRKVVQIKGRAFKTNIFNYGSNLNTTDMHMSWKWCIWYEIKRNLPKSCFTSLIFFNHSPSALVNKCVSSRIFTKYNNYCCIDSLLLNHSCILVGYLNSTLVIIFKTLKCLTQYITAIIVSIAGGAAQHFRALLIPQWFDIIL